MSRSFLYAVYESYAAAFAEIHDGGGLAPQLWDDLTRLYLGREPDWGTHAEQGDLWALIVNPSVNRSLRIALAFTLDFALVTAEGKYEAVCAFMNTAAFSRARRGSTHSAWTDVAMAVATQPITVNMLGIGAGCTAVRNAWEHRRDPARYFCCVTMADQATSPSHGVISI